MDLKLKSRRSAVWQSDAETSVFARRLSTAPGCRAAALPPAQVAIESFPPSADELTFVATIMLFVEVIFKNLARRKTRLVLTTAGLAAGVAATISLLSIAWTFVGSAVDYYAARGVDIVVVRAGVTERITSSLTARLASRLAALPEVAAVEGSLTEMVSLGQHTLVGIPLHGLDPAGFTAKRLSIGSGRNLTASDRRAVLLGSGLAHALGKAPGNTVEIEGTPFEVVGVFQTENALEANTAVAPLVDVQNLMGRGGQVSEFQLQVAPNMAREANLRGVCRRIEALQDDGRRSLGFKALPARQFVDTDNETRITRGMAWGTTAITVVLSLLGMLNTMLMSVLERTKELGILRALGWTRARVVRMILGESVLIGFLGSLCGATAAALLLRALASWSFTRNFVQPGLSPAAVVTGICLTLAAGLAGSFYPAYRGASVPPTEALHHE